MRDHARPFQDAPCSPSPATTPVRAHETRSRARHRRQPDHAPADRSGACRRPADRGCGRGVQPPAGPPQDRRSQARRADAGCRDAGRIRPGLPAQPDGRQADAGGDGVVGHPFRQRRRDRGAVAGCRGLRGQARLGRHGGKLCDAARPRRGGGLRAGSPAPPRRAVRRARTPARATGHAVPVERPRRPDRVIHRRGRGAGTHPHALPGRLPADPYHPAHAGRVPDQPRAASGPDDGSAGRAGPGRRAACAGLRPHRARRRHPSGRGRRPDARLPARARRKAQLPPPVRRCPVRIRRQAWPPRRGRGPDRHGRGRRGGAVADAHGGRAVPSAGPRKLGRLGDAAGRAGKRRGRTRGAAA